MCPSPREKFLSLSLESNRKSYYPQLRRQLEAAKESEKRLQLLMDNLPARISFVDKNERYVFVNRGYEKAFNLARSQIIGQTIRSILREDDYSKAKPYIDAALRGKRVNYENTFADAAGEPRLLNVTYVPDIRNEGEVSGFYVLSLDLTEKRQTEEALRQKDRLLREIGTIAKIGGWEFDPATASGTWTDEVARIFDISPLEEPDVEKGLRFFHDEARHRLEKAIERAVENGTSWDLELEIKTAKNALKWVRTIGQPVAQHGKVVQVRGALQDITEHVLTAKAHLASEERFRLLVESAPDAIFVQTRGLFAYVNSAAVALFGAQSANDLLGQSVVERFHPDDRNKVRERIRTLREEKRSVPIAHEVCIRLDGTSVDIEASAIPMNYQGHDGALVFARDITERLKAEKEQQLLQQQLHQAQKMESIGRLAGGVAHDYNNFLSVIIGYTELSLIGLAPDHPLHKNLSEVLDAASRSKAVTHQLLAFARKEAISPEVLDLNTVVENMLKIIRRLIGENIELIWRPKADLWPIEMDPSQIDQILANLCVNARDAIENVGRVDIETQNVTVKAVDGARSTEIVPGDFVLLTVSDTGSGLDKETADKIFEPFFTTKSLGKGTGLGLATVYGIVKQNNGAIEVDSEPGKGTTFKIYLPRHTGRAQTAEQQASEQIPRGEGETILIVEDESSILALAKRVLERFGYRVLTAGSPVDALRIVSDYGEDISLVITDVIMPDMNGRQLVEKIKAFHPHLKFFYMSGYPRDVISESGVLNSDARFLQKPFSTKDLVAMTRDVLESTRK